MTRTGKIARLPKTVRDPLNRRLRDGEPGKRLVAWLNTLPEVQRVLEVEFSGRPVTEQNLSEWKTGGHREWLLQQDVLERARDLAEHADDLRGTAGALADHLGIVLTSRYAAALAEWDGDPEGGIGRKLRVLRALCQDVVELRRGDHSAARLKLEQARLEAEREMTEDEAVEHFQRWAQNPKVREALYGCQPDAAEKERRIREIFGLGPVGPGPLPGTADSGSKSPAFPEPPPLSG